MWKVVYPYEDPLYPYNVEFLDQRGIRLIKSFTSYDDARKFVWKLRYSKVSTVVSYNFRLDY
jgi:hypothetical protein